MKNRITLLLFLPLVCLFTCCQVYKQNIMFQVDEDQNYDTLNAFVEELNSNYILKADDKISMNVYTGNGEMLIDPENRLLTTQNMDLRVEDPEYLITVDGTVSLPLIGKINLEGLTIPETDSVLSSKYNLFYENSFVLTKCVNRRVSVLGAMGGFVVPLKEENVTLLEVLAAAGGIDNTAKVKNIRLIRGDLSSPSVQIIDLSTVEGLSKANLKVKSGDVIYVEPVRKVVSETLRDLSPIISLATSFITLTFLLTSNRR